MERLEEERNGRECGNERRARVDARADDRKVGLPASKHRDRRDASVEDRLENRRVYVGTLVVAVGSEDNRLMPEASDDTRDERANLRCRVSDEDSRHTPTVGSAAWNWAGFWYGKGMTRARVLVVDDDADVRGLVVQLLGRAGYDVTAASDGREALRALFAARPDLVLLDVTMPGMDGWKALDRIRDVSDVPVLMLTGRTAELDSVRALTAGADDYVTKPFRRQELLARVQALLRRRAPRVELETYEDALLRIDFPRRAVTVAGHPVALTPTEFKLLATFVRHPNQVLSREQILELVWNDPYAVSPDQVKLYVGYLRRKLEVGGLPVPIETVRGFGYRYTPPAD